MSGGKVDVKEKRQTKQKQNNNNNNNKNNSPNIYTNWPVGVNKNVNKSLITKGNCGDVEAAAKYIREHHLVENI